MIIVLVMHRTIRIKSKPRLNASSMINLFPTRFLVPNQMTSTSSRSSTQNSLTHSTDSLCSNLVTILHVIDLFKINPDTRFTLTDRGGWSIISAVGVGGHWHPCCHRRHPCTTAIQIDQSREINKALPRLGPHCQ